MAKKKDKNEQQTIKPVTNCDQFPEVVENFHHFKENESILSVHDIEKLIVTLRGVQVIIDRDLAFLYQEEVKQMNRQVKRNIERFPADFMFQLTKEEYASLKCHFGTSNERGGDRRALPYAFTQQGIGMLSGLLRSQVAIETNIKIMRAFVGMQRYIAASMQLFQRLNIVELQQLFTDGRMRCVPTHNTLRHQGVKPPKFQFLSPLLQLGFQNLHLPFLQLFAHFCPLSDPKVQFIKLLIFNKLTITFPLIL